MIKSTLRELIELSSVSGSEYKFADKLKKYFSDSCDEVWDDVSGNVIGLKKSLLSRKKVLIDAHFDVIGLMVSAIEDDGLVRFVCQGGVDERILPSMRVVIHGKEDIGGVIGVPPPHLLNGNEDGPYKAENLKIDTGFDRDELIDKISVGDLISFSSSYTELLNGRVASSGLDNKAGVYVLTELAKSVNLKNTDLFFAATSGEEINLNGATAFGGTEEFDLCIIIDVTHGETPDSTGHITFPLSGGAVLTYGPLLSKKHNDILKKYAEKNNIPYSAEVVTSSSGTNSTAYETALCGNRCIVVSIPLRYMHTAYETADLADIENVISLIRGFLEECYDGEE